jgi:RNA-directed DNA polymerase
LDLISAYAFERLPLFVGTPHQRGAALRPLALQQSDRDGLISLNATVIAPTPNRVWRGTPNAGGERTSVAVCGRTACTVDGGREETSAS